MSDSVKRRSLIGGAALGIAGTLSLVLALGLLAGSGVAASQATPPSNTSPPTISGAAQKGQRLHASPGDWSGSNPIHFAYRWQRCNASGASCNNINGATDNDYTLVQADVGRTVRVVVTATNPAGTSSAASSPTAVVVAPQLPAVSVPPSISGTAQLGSTLTASPGTWKGSQPITFTYQWLRCDANGGACGNIGGAATSTYLLASADVGHAIRLRVTAHNAFGATSATTVPTAAVSGTANGCPLGIKVAPVTAVVPPARLVVETIHFTPFVLRRTSHGLVASFLIRNTCNQPVQGALVYATAVPYNQLSATAEAVSGPDGWATLTFRTMGGFPVSKAQQLMTLFVRARKPGESPLSGISTRRLVSLHVVG
jgi:hypothetical protein